MSYVRSPFFEGDVREPDGERARADEQQREVDRQGEDHRDLQPVAPEPCAREESNITVVVKHRGTSQSLRY